MEYRFLESTHKTLLLCLVDLGFMPQGVSSKCFSSSKTSRISLIDLAGLDRNKLEDVGRQHVQEGKNVKKSLSQLGYAVIKMIFSCQHVF